MKHFFSVFPSGIFSCVVIEAHAECDYVNIKLPNNYCSQVNVKASIDTQSVLLFRDATHELVIEYRPVRARRRVTDVQPDPPLQVPPND